MTAGSDITYRPLEDHEMGFVLSPLVANLRPIYKEHASWRACALVAESTVTVAEADGVLLGFVVTRAPFVEFAYVKHDYRQQGICRELVRRALGRYTPVITHLLPKKQKLAAKFKKQAFNGEQLFVYECAAPKKEDDNIQT